MGGKELSSNYQALVPFVFAIVWGKLDLDLEFLNMIFVTFLQNAVSRLCIKHVIPGDPKLSVLFVNNFAIFCSDKGLHCVIAELI